ncbi:hypothetical protein VCV18_003958 [Metarhizium anisopliae]
MSLATRRGSPSAAPPPPAVFKPGASVLPSAARRAPVDGTMLQCMAGSAGWLNIDPSRWFKLSPAQATSSSYSPQSSPLSRDPPVHDPQSPVPVSPSPRP